MKRASSPKLPELDLEFLRHLRDVRRGIDDLVRHVLKGRFTVREIGEASGYNHATVVRTQAGKQLKLLPKNLRHLVVQRHVQEQTGAGHGGMLFARWRLGFQMFRPAAAVDRVLLTRSWQPDYRISPSRGSVCSLRRDRGAARAKLTGSCVCGGL